MLSFTDETGGKNYVKMADVVHRLEDLELWVRDKDVRARAERIFNLEE